MNEMIITNTIHKMVAQPAISSVYEKAESFVNNTKEMSYDPAVKSLTYKAMNGFGLSLDWEHDTVSVNWADVILSYCWKDRKFEMSRSAV